jgi:hypothetical protein
MQTISEAFAAWSDIQARLPGADDATFNHLAAEQARIEQAAVHLPVTSAQDAFRLLAMTCDEDSDTTFAAEALFRRAREEVSTTAPRPPVLASIFDRWLPLAQRSADGTATDDEVMEGLALVRMAVQVPAADPLDVWRKVAMTFDLFDPYHIGTAAALMDEARQALGIKPDAHH